MHFDLRPETWPQAVQLALVCLAAGLGAFLATRIRATSRWAFVVAIAATVFAGGAAYLIFHPPLPHVPGVQKAAKPLKPEGPSPHAPSASHPAGAGAKTAAVAKKVVRIEWDEAKKRYLVDSELVTVSEIVEKLKKAKSQHPEPSEVSVLLGKDLLRSPQHRKEVEKACAELKITVKEEAPANPKH